MKLLFFMLSSIPVIHSIQTYTAPIQAVTKVPVADLIGDSLSKKYKAKEVFLYYNNLPLCGQRPYACSRIHQLLFNEIVTILEQKGDEVLVQIPSLFYELKDSDQRQDTYWSLKKNFITFDELKKCAIGFHTFPTPLDYKNHQKSLSSKKVIALTSPFFETVTQQHFSVGTRFVIDNEKKADNKYSIFVFDPKKKSVITAQIPMNICFVENGTDTYPKRVQNFIALLRSWINQKGIIPYVWGGCSLISRCNNNNFELVKKNEPGRSVSYYARSECSKENPKNGFDCTGLIARAAQICGLPYYYKNSTTVLKYLKPVAQAQPLKEGDLIWLPGHIMVIASKRKNTIIEARAYNHGFGKVHEIPLNKVFQGITTYAQLQNACKREQSLRRLDSKGKVIQIIDTFKLLTLESLWTKS